MSVFASVGPSETLLVTGGALVLSAGVFQLCKAQNAQCLQLLHVTISGFDLNICTCIHRKNSLAPHEL